MTIGFGIIGCGMIADFHQRAIADVPNASLVGCVDSHADSAQRFADQYGCTAYSSLEAMFADSRVQAVSICTPSGAHLEPAVAAAQAGRHVVVEKPLEVTLDRCDQMIRACDSAGVILSTIFQSRFHESARLLKSAVDAGRFGVLTLANAYVKWYRTQEYYDSGQWRGTWSLDGGGALMNQAIHSIDLLSWLMGPVQEISAITSTLAHTRIEVEDTAVASLRFANGALGSIEATTAAYPGSLKRIEVYGSNGSAVMQEENITSWSFANTDEADEQILQRLKNKTATGGGASDPSAIDHSGHTCQFRDVVSAIERRGTPLIDGQEARRSVEIVLAIYRASESGQRVTLPLN